MRLKKMLKGWKDGEKWWRDGGRMVEGWWKDGGRMVGGWWKVCGVGWKVEKDG